MANVIEFELATEMRAEAVKAIRDNAEIARDFALTLKLAIEGANHSDMSKEDILLALEMPTAAIIEHADAAATDAHRLSTELK